jgi:cytosine/uracil/thiamine/allantoin permease
LAKPDLEADAVAKEHARRIVGRVALKKISALTMSWKKEEEAEKRVGRWVLVGIGFIVVLVALLRFVFYGHPKVRLFVVSLGFGIIVAAGMVIWSQRRQTRKPTQSVKADAQKSDARPTP